MFSLNAHAQPTGDYSDIRAAYSSYLLDIEPVLDETAISAYRSAMAGSGAFTDLVYETTQANNSIWAYNAHASRLAQMAEAWASPSHPLYQDATLLAEIKTSMDWFWTNHVTANNWWHNEIGIPTSFASMLTLLWEQLTATQRTNAITILTRARIHNWSASSLPMVGANRLWRAQVSLIEAAFTSNATLAQTEATATANTMVQTSGEGIKFDNSFHQHDMQLYNGGYGQVFALSGAAILRQLVDTQWALTATKRDLLVNYLLDGTRWMIHGPRFDYSTVGREITRQDNGADPSRTVSALKLLRDTGTPRQSEIDAFLAHFSGAPGAVPGLVTGAKHFPRSDYTVFRRAGHALSVRALSTRTYCQETGNGENTRAVHLSHGSAYYFTDGLDYFGIIPVWDWKKIPGTTVANNSLFADVDPPIKGTTTFVGAVTDGQRAATTYQLDFNNSGRLQARKSWFLFDGALVALGAGITYSNTNHEIITTVEQKLLNGNVRVADSSGERDLATGNATLTGARWLLHENTGYFFPTATNLNVQRGPRSGKWSDTSSRESNATVTLDTFTAWMSHGMGANVTDSYAYAILPDATVSSLQAAATAAPFTVISNTPSLQAVHHPASNTAGFIFHAAGNATVAGWPSVTVDRPCALLIRQDSGGWTITGSDPASGSGNLNVTFGGKPLTLTLPSGNEAGGSVSGVLSGTPGVTISSPAQNPAALASTGEFLLLDANVADTFPAGLVTQATWEKVSGPGTVDFYDLAQTNGGALPSAWTPAVGGAVTLPAMSGGVARVLAGAKFSAMGDYSLRLTASASTGNASATLTVRVGSAAPFAPPTASALFWLRLNETSGSAAANSLSSGPAGTYMGAVGLSQAGATAATGTAVSLGSNATSTFVELPPSTSFGSSNGTVSLWFKTSAGNGTLFYGSNATTGDLFGNENEAYLFLNASGNVVASIYYGGGSSATNVTVTHSGNFTDGQWHHVAMTWQNGGTLAVSMNGNTPVSTPYSLASGSHYNFSGLLRLGRSGSGTNASARRFIGTMDEVFLASRALGSDELAALRSASGNMAPRPVPGTYAPLASSGNLSLSGGLSDDAIRRSPVTTQWVTLAGPAATTFAASNALSTTVTLPSPGTYTLALLASDGIATSFATTQAIVNAGFDAWISSLPTPPPANLRGPLDDPDGDGLANLAEYAFGMDPVIPQPLPMTTDITGNYLTLTVAKNNPPPGVNFSAEASGDLATWSPAVTIANNATLFQARDTVISDSNAPKRFLRVKISQ